MLKDWPNPNKVLHDIQEAIVLDDAACTMSKIYVALKCIIFLRIKQLMQLLKFHLNIEVS
jgi:hypothetical protein